MPASFFGSIVIWSGLTIYPRYSISCFSKSHFSGLRNKSSFQHISKIRNVLSHSCLRVSAKIRMLSMYARHHPSVISVQKVLFMMRWNVAGELHSPKNITVGSYSPNGVENAAFQRCSGLIWMLLYPHLTSSLVKNLAPHSSRRRSCMLGSGNASLMVPSFRFL